MQRRSAQPGKYDISLPPTITKSTTDNTALVCRGAKRKDSGVISNFILLIIALRLLLPKRRGIMMAIDKGRTGVQRTVLSHRETKTWISAPNSGSLPVGEPYIPRHLIHSLGCWSPGDPSLPVCRCEHGQPRLCMAGALDFPFGFSQHAGRPRPGQRDTHSSTASLPSHFIATSRKTWTVVCSCFSVTEFSARFFFFFLIAI